MSKKASVMWVAVALFVAAGVAAGLVIVKAKGDPRGANGPPAGADPSSVGIKSPRSQDSEGAPSKPSSSRVIAYYFHRTVRCHTCLAIEDLSRKTIENLFGEELAEGRIEWRPVDIDGKGNEHYEDDFNLKNQSLVLVKLEGGKEAGWKNLTSVWDLVDDPEAFTRYVQEELSKYLRP